METGRIKQIPYLLAGLCVIVIIASLLFGSVNLEFNRLYEVFESGSLYSNIVFGLRLPRVLGAILCGGSLALSGAVMQSVLANPLAAPHSMGINAGAGLAAAIVGAFFPFSYGMAMSAALIGALASSFCILSLARRFRLSKTTIILAGTAFSQIFAALIDLIITLYPDALAGYTAFRLGSLANLSWAQLIWGAVICIPAAVLILIFARQMELLLLGHEMAQALGLNASKWMVILLALGALLAGGSVSIAGLIGFVGLITPHAIRYFVPDFGRTYLVSCMLGGALLVMSCDFAARILAAPHEIPVGVVMALAGGPYFLWLLFGPVRKKR